MSLPDALAGLAAPNLIEALDYEGGLALFKAQLVAAFDAAGIAYDVETLETDPGVILTEVAAYADTRLRARINAAIQSSFLAFATGTDVDNLAQFYDVSRLSGESDDALKARVVLAIQGRSTGGTAARYKSIALSADVRVADVAVYTVGRDPTVNVAVFSTDNSGVADQPLLDAVDAALQVSNVRMVNDTIAVAAAAQVTIDVTADIYLLPEASGDTLDRAEAALSAAWGREMGLGRDVTLSWVMAQLHVDGVQSVEIVAPAAAVVMPFNQAAALGTVTLTQKGRAY